MKGWAKQIKKERDQHGLHQRFKIQISNRSSDFPPVYDIELQADRFWRLCCSVAVVMIVLP